ncbi:MAG TPA: DUF6036 family nucleotidyltransferase [Candidatus Limnocylindria bacterium]|nr:DUF6036 family nucleotidyltransferase [Candidatus Limnocylindria bacterium]
MNREQLDHVLRAAADIVEDADILIIGSQAILATASESELPIEAMRSIEVDLAFFDDEDAERADAVDGAIGELSRFHETFGYYGQGVSLSTAVLPEDWIAEVVELDPPVPGSRVRALGPHDCVASKLVANREKDRAFAKALLEAGIVDPDHLVERINLLPRSIDEPRRRRLIEWVRNAAARSASG